MMHAVIRNGTDALHLVGHVDAYTLESLKEHTRAMTATADTLCLTIELAPNDEATLARHAGAWLARLRRRGVSVQVRSDGDLPSAPAGSVPPSRALSRHLRLPSR